MDFEAQMSSFYLPPASVDWILANAGTTANYASPIIARRCPSLTSHDSASLKRQTLVLQSLIASMRTHHHASNSNVLSTTSSHTAATAISSPSTTPSPTSKKSSTDRSNSNANNDDDDEEDDEIPLPDELLLPTPPPPPSFHLPHVLSAIGAGILTSIFTQPFDVVRTRLAVQQKSHNPVYKGLFGSLSMTYRAEGVRGLYRGFGPTVIVVPLFWAIYFSCYSDFKERLKANDTFNYLPLWSQHLIAACSSGAIADVIVNPLFVVRTRMQTQHMQYFQGAVGNGPAAGAAASTTGSATAAAAHHPPLYGNTASTLVRLVREEGFMSLFRGVSASLLGLSHVMIQFPAYEHLKQLLPELRVRAAERKQQARDGIEPSSNAAAITSSAVHVEATMFDLIGASALSKMLASILTYPHEVIRARMQHAPSSVFGSLRDCAKKTVRNEGFGALYKGLGVNLIRTVPGCALTFVSYEMLLKEITHRYHLHYNYHPKSTS